MSTPEWWASVVGLSEVLAVEDRAEVARWRDGSGVDEDGDVPPLTVRLAHLGRALAEHVDAMTPQQRRLVLDLLERVLATGSEHDSTAVATGFLEALVSAWDRGFDFPRIWDDLGPKSQEYCIAWNAFNRIDLPPWMRVSR
ncbi:DUF7674 family protein [Planosporangium sp. 12N6]|uniref:DUF7674 family protein n=1 Tax=Planosporangium spinosum TaxID=3402278 RepID=UPI003CFA746E